jgi:site-specific recombinase XerD
MEKHINNLIDDCIIFFNESCYTQARIDKYKSLWRSGIVSYMGGHEISLYSPDVGQRFLKECVPMSSSLKYYEREKVRSIQVLDDYLHLGLIRKTVIIPVKHPLNGPIGKEMYKLINHLQSLRRSKITIKDYELYLNRFLTYLDREGVCSVNEISERHVLKFISTQENNKINIVSSLRVLFRYWYENHIMDADFEAMLKSYKWNKKERIPSFYTKEEINKIETSVDRNSSVGKRNYAMLLLASRLGLRASDIANLKFSNIDWEKNEITLLQYKTGCPVLLPLLTDVGNAIVDYLQYGRFRSDSQSVFISSRAPYVDATREMVCSAISHIIEQTDVSIKYRHHGPHSMRHSLAGCCLENGVSMPVISEILGHRNTDSTLTYLKIDISSLQKCALAVLAVTDAFYEQKGGVFYE